MSTEDREFRLALMGLLSAAYIAGRRAERKAAEWPPDLLVEVINERLMLDLDQDWT